MYQEVIPRELTYGTQVTISQETHWYIRKEDGLLDMPKLLAAFQDFFRKYSGSWVERFQYKEAGPQLLMQAFPQRILNTGGHIHRGGFTETIFHQPVIARTRFPKTAKLGLKPKYGVLKTT